MKKIVTILLSLILSMTTVSLCYADNPDEITGEQINASRKYINQRYTSRLYIDREEHLILLREIVMGNASYPGRPLRDCIVVLRNNINLTTQWTPIGDENHRFEGLFLGNGYTINNMMVDSNERNLCNMQAANSGNMNANTMNFFIYLGEHGEVRETLIQGSIFKNIIKKNFFRGCSFCEGKNKWGDFFWNIDFLVPEQSQNIISGRVISPNIPRQQSEERNQNDSRPTQGLELQSNKLTQEVNKNKSNLSEDKKTEDQRSNSETSNKSGLVTPPNTLATEITESKSDVDKTNKEESQKSNSETDNKSGLITPPNTLVTEANENEQNIFDKRIEENPNEGNNDVDDMQQMAVVNPSVNIVESNANQNINKSNDGNTSDEEDLNDENEQNLKDSLITIKEINESGDSNKFMNIVQKTGKTIEKQRHRRSDGHRKKHHHKGYHHRHGDYYHREDRHRRGGNAGSAGSGIHMSTLN